MGGWGEISQEEKKEKSKKARSVAVIFDGSPDDNGIVIGSGFLIDQQTILTAKHILKNKDISTICCGFGFYEREEEEGYTEKEHYWVRTANPDLDSDWATLTLDEEVKGRTPLKINESGEFEETDKMFVIGNPEGVPTKISEDCMVTIGVLKDFFDIELKPEDCASGAPVFNSRTLMVEGILISGESWSHCLRSSVFG